ncbi:hypothetical protein [Leifsonia sp. NPDC058248]|uniref:hypothetical protein n=1 Tax=Leifsonia sp. NPDC058248 TaxID=3346402 RepID=UPI0036D9F8AE
MNSTNNAYRVGLIPPQALAADLAASGLTYSPGRGHGYRLNGAHVTPYDVGDVIADIFSGAAEVLGYYLNTDPVMLAVELDETLLARMPFRDADDDRARARDTIRRRIDAAESGLSISRDQLVLAQESLAQTASTIQGIQYVRQEAVRRFRSAIPAPPRQRVDGHLAVSVFLLAQPEGLIARKALHEAALAAGLSVGSRTLYAAADALGWAIVTRRGTRFYSVPGTA